MFKKFKLMTNNLELKHSEQAYDKFNVTGYLRTFENVR